MRAGCHQLPDTPRRGSRRQRVRFGTLFAVGLDPPSGPAQCSLRLPNALSCPDPAASSRYAPGRHALVRSATRGGRVRVVAMVAALGGSGVGDSGAGGLGRARGCRDSDLLQGVSRTRTVGTTPDEGRLGARLQVRDRAWHPATHIRGAGRGRQVPPPDKQQEVQQNTETEARREEGRHEHPRAPERHPVPPPRQLGRSAVIR